MKIALSKPGEAGTTRRHLVLVCETSESYEALRILQSEVLRDEEGVVRPVTERGRVHGRPIVRIRLAMKWLEKLMLAFPFADVSDGLDKRLTKKALEEIRAMRVPSIEIENIHFTPHDFQKVAIARLIHRKRFLENDELGLGKTYISGAAGVELVNRGKVEKILCVVTNTSKYPTWVEFWENQTDLSWEVVDGTAQQRRDQITAGADVTIIHHEGLRAKYELGKYQRNEDGSVWYDEEGHRRRTKEFRPVHPELFDKGRYDLIILDEYQIFRNPKAQQTVGLHHLRAPYKWAMSGTGVVNGRPEEYWSALHWLWPKLYPDYDQFVAEHVIQSAGKTVGYRGLSKIKEFVDERKEDGITPMRSIRRRKEWVRDDLPEVIPMSYELTMTKEQRKIYKEIQEDLRLRLDDGEFKSITTALAQTTRLKQACFSPELFEGSPTSPKIDQLKALMEELTNNGEKALVFSEWSKATRIIQRELEQYYPAYIDGSVKPKNRGEQVKMFNNDEDCRVFIGTISSCNSSITLGAATYVIFTDLDWVPAHNDQAIGRSAAGGLRGVGATNPVTVVEMKMKDSIEQDIDMLLAKKKKVNARMVERDAGRNSPIVTTSDIRNLILRNIGLDDDDE